MKDSLMLFGLFGFVTVLGFVGGHDMHEAEQADALYAEMVCLGIATNNEFGWPNYKNLEVNCDNN